MAPDWVLHTFREPSLGVGHDVIELVAQATLTVHEAAHYDIARGVIAPPRRIPSLHGFGLLPALLALALGKQAPSTLGSLSPSSGGWE